jgi:thymidylate synthase (FAD)
MKVKIIATTQALDFEPQYLIEYAGRVCTNSLSRFGQSERFIRQRIDEQHLGLLEHNSVTFLVEGISRTASHQLVRHRLVSYAQMSERYCEFNEPSYVVPESIRKNEEALSAYTKIADGLFTMYCLLRADGIPKEDARFVLPKATKTTILITTNLRGYLHLFDMRIHPAAQWEIRDMCIKMLDLLIYYAPAVFVPYREKVASEHPEWFEAQDE